MSIRHVTKISGFPACSTAIDVRIRFAVAVSCRQEQVPVGQISAHAAGLWTDWVVVLVHNLDLTTTIHVDVEIHSPRTLFSGAMNNARKDLAHPNTIDWIAAGIHHRYEDVVLATTTLLRILAQGRTRRLLST